MWRKIADQCDEFGHPDKFCSDPEQTNWIGATVTTLDGRIPPYVEKYVREIHLVGRL